MEKWNQDYTQLVGLWQCCVGEGVHFHSPFCPDESKALWLLVSCNTDQKGIKSLVRMCFLSKGWQIARCKSPKVSVNLHIRNSRMERRERGGGNLLQSVQSLTSRFLWKQTWSSLTFQSCCVLHLLPFFFFF